MLFSSQNLGFQCSNLLNCIAEQKWGKAMSVRTPSSSGYCKELLKNRLPCEKQTLMQMALEKLSCSLLGLLQKVFLSWVRRILDNCQGPFDSKGCKIDPRVTLNESLVHKS